MHLFENAHQKFSFQKVVLKLITLHECDTPRRNYRDITKVQTDSAQLTSHRAPNNCVPLS